MGLALSELCSLFCCPPIPSKIFNKLMFLSPEPTYAVLADQNGSLKIALSERAEWQYSEADKKAVEMCYATTTSGHQIACMHVRCSPDPRYTLLFSNGNGTDLGMMSSFFLGLGRQIDCNIFSYDYSGYGASEGKPSEAHLYADIAAAWDIMTLQLGIQSENIILYGNSFGAGPAIDLACRVPAAGVILESPITSCLRLAFPQIRTSWFFDPFPNIDKISRVKSPVLVIHGTENEIIDLWHGKAIYATSTNTVRPLWLEGGGADLALYPQYLQRIKDFVLTELPGLQSDGPTAEAQHV